MKTIVIFLLFVCICNVNVIALSFPGPRVYVVTPASHNLQQNEERAPFYYHKWMDGWRRMDTAVNDTTTTTTTPVPKIMTPDLIFAEFESDGSKQKSIRKLLEKEKIKQASTMNPIYVPDEEDNKVTRVVNYGLPVKINSDDRPIEISTEKSTYLLRNKNENMHNVPAPIYVPSTAELTSTTTTIKSPVNIENIWHIIDSEKHNQYSENWHEVPNLEEKLSDNASGVNSVVPDDNQEQNNNNSYNQKESSEEVTIDDNFALPGFATNAGSGAENESRAIRTEPNIRFPYVNLKPFQMKSSKNPLNSYLKGTKNNNILTNLDQFSDLKHPVRGEAQDIDPSSTLIDRYNPAQPYLPQPNYGNKVSKQSSPAFVPQKATASLVPPPPPLPPKGTNFPAPISYDSFPPYPPSGSDFNGSPVLPIPPVPASIVGSDTSSSEGSDSSDDDGGLAMDLGYRYKPSSPSDDSNNSPMNTMGYQYKPPSPPVPQFIPTIPPPEPQPFAGYSYNKPSMSDNSMPMPETKKPEMLGYHYSKPELPQPDIDHMPPTFDSPPSYGHDDVPPDYGSHHNSDYPEIVYQKPHNDIKDGDTNDDMGMMPPSPPTDMKDMAYGPPPHDHGFPVDFPTDFKFHHDFDDDHDHYHYHHPTTTTTTEMPRVNRFSYYYLGKKLYYLPLYFSVYFIIYVGALIIKAVLRHKIVYPNSWRPNTQTASFFSKRSVDEFMTNENLHEVTGKVTHAIATAAEKYMNKSK